MRLHTQPPDDELMGDWLPIVAALIVGLVLLTGINVAAWIYDSLWP